MFDVRYKGLRIAVSKAAMRELVKEGKTLLDVVDILERGYESPRKRGKDVLEKWLDAGGKTFEAVVARDYNEMLKEEVWVLIHFGRFTRRQGR